MARVWCPGYRQIPVIRDRITYCPVCDWRGSTGLSGTVSHHVERPPLDPRTATQWLADTYIEIMDEYQQRLGTERLGIAKKSY
jgi:hypothetical protein